VFIPGSNNHNNQELQALKLDSFINGGSENFFWAAGIENTFVPQVRNGHRSLDEYELMGHYEHWREDLGLSRELGLN
jgi:hypothetical protein